MIDRSQKAPNFGATRSVQIWLYAVAALVLLMVAVGGATRLTDSGLSITSWKPIAGMVPPLSLASWQAEFDAYKLIPEYAQVNLGMTLAQFKGIFWWEWGHRFLGRLIGMAFALPLIFFIVTRQISPKLIPQLVVLFFLGGFQGALGWWMVSSGLSERIDVSQYRLAAHLCAAALLFAALLWVARGIGAQKPAQNEMLKTSWLVPLIWWLTLLQLVAGAFVAGLHAGLLYNTWPLMEGRIIPKGMMSQQPVWKNLFENTLTVQFDHRLIAYTLAAAVLAHYLTNRHHNTPKYARVWARLLAKLVFVQIVLGVSTLIFLVPIPLALAHQVLALLIFGVATLYSRDISLQKLG